MSTVPEFLRHDLRVGEHASLVLRSGVVLAGDLEEVDLVAAVVRLGGWTVRIEEVAGARVGEGAASTARRLRLRTSPAA